MFLLVRLSVCLPNCLPVCLSSRIPIFFDFVVFPNVGMLKIYKKRSKR